MPFVVGVLGDFAGEQQLPALNEREFIEINKDNFDHVIEVINPKLNLNLTEQQVQLEFSCIDDFTPDNIIQQLPYLKELKQARDMLRDLLSKADVSRELTQTLENCLQDSNSFQDLISFLKEESDATATV